MCYKSQHAHTGYTHSPEALHSHRLSARSGPTRTPSRKGACEPPHNFGRAASCGARTPQPGSGTGHAMTGDQPWRLGPRHTDDHSRPRRDSGPTKAMAACVTSFAIRDPDTREHVVL